MQRVDAAHVPIARDLGDDRRRRDRGARRVPVHDRPALVAVQVAEGEAVRQQDRARARDLQQRGAQRRDVHLVEAAGVDRVDAA
jgi:hypothetical protein